MSSLNQVNLIGNLGRDPEVLKSSEKGDFVRLSLATTKRYRIKEGKVQEDTQWHTIYASNGLGKIAATYLKKGARIFITGELRTHEWQEKSGKIHTSTAIYAKDIKFLSTKPPEKKDADLPIEPIEESGAYDKAMEQIREALGNHFNTNT
jgi:single-strand DNA-binding protein